MSESVVVGVGGGGGDIGRGGGGALNLLYPQAGACQWPLASGQCPMDTASLAGDRSERPASSAIIAQNIRIPFNRNFISLLPVRNGCLLPSDLAFPARFPILALLRLIRMPMPVVQFKTSEVVW